MEITERDLFNYIFNRQLVNEEKAGYLMNSEEYKEELEFLNLLKDSLSAVISRQIKEKIAAKIPAYRYGQNSDGEGYIKVVELYPVDQKIKKKNKNTKQVFAADSEELKPQHVSQTFSDENREYLVKLIRSGSSAKIFVFSTTESELKNVKLTVHPGEKEYLLEDNSVPLEVNENITAESISLGIRNLQG